MDQEVVLPLSHAVGGVERLTLGTGQVPALLIRPAGSGPHPAAVLQHGYGSRKEDLLPLATSWPPMGSSYSWPMPGGMVSAFLLTALPG